MRIIGDIHGKSELYLRAIQGAAQSIQVGDMGFNYDFLDKVGPIDNVMVPGNHDNYHRLPPHALGDWGIWEGWSYIRGALSLDWARRTENKNWFREEELSQTQFYQILDWWEKTKPKKVVSHDCPISIVKMIHDRITPTRTQQGLQACLDNHRPEVWVFGHHHTTFDQTIEGTRFIGLDEGQWIDI